MATDTSTAPGSGKTEDTSGAEARVRKAKEAAEKGRAYTAGYMDKGIARKKATPEKKEAALYKALDYLTFYELRDYSQEVAANITKYDALVERAIIMLAPELANANSIAASPLVVKESSSVKQGLVAESKEYARPSADRFPQVTALLQPILVSSKLGGNGLMRIIRN